MDEGRDMYRSLGRLFMKIPKAKCIEELQDNEKHLKQESTRYEELRTTYKTKQDTFKQ